MDKKVELQVINITNSQAQIGAFAMLLGEVDGERQLPIIIGPAEAQATALYLKGVKTPRPLTHDLFITSLTVLGAGEGVHHSAAGISADNRSQSVGHHKEQSLCAGTNGRIGFLFNKQ